MKKPKKTKLDRLTPETRALVEARHKAGFSQEALAARSGISIGPIVKFESGRKTRPHTDAMLRKAYAELSMMKFDKVKGDGGTLLDAAWLRRQTETFLRVNALGVVEKGGQAHFVISSETVYRFGKAILLASGKNID